MTLLSSLRARLAVRVTTWLTGQSCSVKEEPECAQTRVGALRVDAEGTQEALAVLGEDLKAGFTTRSAHSSFIAASQAVRTARLALMGFFIFVETVLADYRTACSFLHDV